jgi:preprotein translocase subunit SecA
MREGEAIESGLLTRQIERAQRKVEAHNFDMRKILLEYDDVANDQRQVIYQQRNELMEAEEIGDSIAGIRAEVVDSVIDEHIPPQSMEESWDVPGLTHALEHEFGTQCDIAGWLEEDTTLDEAALRDKIIAAIDAEYDAKAEQVGVPLMRMIEKEYMLKFLDMHWREHLAALDYLRQGIGLRSYAQKNPKQEYKREAFEMFGEMLDRVKRELIGFLSKVQVRGQEDVEAAHQRPAPTQMQYQHAEASALAAPPPQPAAAQQGQRPAAGQPPVPPPPPQDPAAPFVRQTPKIGRNEPCHCGSGKKFKHCHGKLG